MPSRKFLLDKKNNQELEIKWKWHFQKIIVYLGVKKLWLIDAEKDLKQWKEFELDNGSKLFVKVVKYLWFIPELEILLDWKILPDSPTDPNLQLDQVFWLIAVIAWLNILLGILWSLWIDFLIALQVGFVSIVYGLLLLVLAVWLKKKCGICLWIIVVLWIIELVYRFYLMMNTGDVSVWWIIIKIVILVFMLRGFSAIKKLKKEKQ